MEKVILELANYTLLRGSSILSWSSLSACGVITSATRTRVRVTGIGGIFLKAKKPNKLSQWYTKHLGISIMDNVALFTWASQKNPKNKGYTVWSIFPKNTKYFGRKDSQFMINYRVKNLKGLVQTLKRERVKVAGKIEESKYGKFAWITDPEGNRIELWEPPRRYQAPEKEIPME